MPPKRTIETSRMLPDIQVAENQSAAATLNMVLARFEDMILEILTTYLDPIVARFNAHQEILNDLTTQWDDRSPSSLSEEHDDLAPMVGRCKRTPSAQQQWSPWTRPTNPKMERCKGSVELLDSRAKRVNKTKDSAFHDGYLISMNPNPVMSTGRVGSRFWDVSDSTGRSCQHIITRPISDRSGYSGVITRPIFRSVGF